jgi:molybdopterin-guanine dinucleotide biosynthesis protein A
VRDDGMRWLSMTAAVLAGGESRRMGRDKALLELGGRPLIVRQVAALRELFACVIVCANDTARFAGLDVPVVPDEGGAGNGPLGGLAAAIRAAPTTHVFCCAVDMPFLSPDLIRYQALLAPGHDAVVPRAEGAARGKTALEPLHAVYRKSCLGHFRAKLAAGERKLERALDGLRIRIVEPGEVAVLDPDRRSLRNVNTPEDLALAEGELGEAAGEV